MRGWQRRRRLKIEDKSPTKRGWKVEDFFVSIRIHRYCITYSSVYLLTDGYVYLDDTYVRLFIPVIFYNTFSYAKQGEAYLHYTSASYFRVRSKGIKGESKKIESKGKTGPFNIKRM